MKELFLILLTAILFTTLLSSCGGGNCEPYGEWKYEKTVCDPNFWCFLKNQHATYDIYVAQKQCDKGLVQKRKKEKRHCGC